MVSDKQRFAKIETSIAQLSEALQTMSLQLGRRLNGDTNGGERRNRRRERDERTPGIIDQGQGKRTFQQRESDNTRFKDVRRGLRRGHGDQSSREHPEEYNRGLRWSDDGRTGRHQGRERPNQVDDQFRIRDNPLIAGSDFGSWTFGAPAADSGFSSCTFGAPTADSSFGSNTFGAPAAGSGTSCTKPNVGVPTTGRGYIQLSNDEILRRRQLGQCFTCDAKYTWNHVCPNAKVLSLIVEDDPVVERDYEKPPVYDEEESEAATATEEPKEASISFNNFYSNEKARSIQLEVPWLEMVFSLENGPTHAIWKEIGVPLTVNTADQDVKCAVDWLNYDGILVNSLNAVEFFPCLMQEPFKNVLLVWTIHEQTLAARLSQYVSSGQSELVDIWRNTSTEPLLLYSQTIFCRLLIQLVILETTSSSQDLLRSLV
ncbi:hypothetical protein ACS0TY_023581 [Phlomoides rotata]